MSLWYVLCLLFLVYAIRTLEEERYEVTYAVDQTHPKLGNYSVCIPLEELNVTGDREDFFLEELNSQIFRHFNSASIIESHSQFEHHGRDRQFGQHESDLQLEHNRSHRQKHENHQQFEKHDQQLGQLRGDVLQAIESSRFYYHRYHFCLLLANGAGRTVKRFYGGVKYFSFLQKPFVFFVHHYPSDRFNQIVILNLPYPYSRCQRTGDESGIRYSRGTHYSRFACINKCNRKSLKSDQQVLKYLYEGTEKHERIAGNFADDQALRKNEDRCFEHCRMEDCESIYKLPAIGQNETSEAISNLLNWPIYFGIRPSCTKLSSFLLWSTEFLGESKKNSRKIFTYR